ncbi:hypothetical protein B0H16DRAFT_1713677 [Mycena metata]|uniref:Uncharacterized protein n=1 Tax=Mycena metata TaxID=1033252 RepID=A0AAD7NSJ4_9AGAR|nr:hypothetical protein B0H16DRAFT_1713677 [Mycena metata]
MLPDEIVSEIVSPALKISDDLFSDTNRTSPFAVPSESTSAILVVCKAWLRVATPLLYHVVILRSRAQARALQRTLRDNPDFGKWIKKIRIEGGFGPAMELILKTAPNITDIFLSFSIHASDSTTGLVLGLPHIDPTRLIIWEGIPLRNKHVRNLVQSVEDCALGWKKITSLSLPYVPLFNSERLNLATILCTGPNVKEISFPDLGDFEEDLPLIKKFASVSKLEAIVLQRYWACIPWWAAEDPVLAPLVRLKVRPEPTEEEDDLPTILPSDPSFRPLESTPQEIADRIWSRILGFATLPPGNPTVRVIWDDDVHYSRLDLILVSKMFHRIALPHLYRCVALTLDDHTRRLAEKVTSTPALGQHIREIAVYGHQSEDDDNVGVPTAELACILRHTPNLTRLGRDDYLWDPAMIPVLEWSVLEVLGEVAGDTVKELEGYKFAPAPDETRPNSPGIFARLTSLRRLTWACTAASTIPFFNEGEMPKHGLPALEFLRVESSVGLSDLGEMDLPNLRRLELKLHLFQDPSFLQKHGHKIEELTIKGVVFSSHSVLALCPHLNQLFCSLPADAESFGTNRLPAGFQHTKLKKMIIRKQESSRKAQDEKAWRRLFDGLDLTCVPALREIQISNIHQWPKTDHEITKSLWVKLAEQLLERGVNLTDLNGNLWRPRLRASQIRR